MSDTAVTGMEPASNRLWSIADAAERLGVSQRYVWQLVHDGVLRKVKQGRRTFIRDDDLVAYIDRITEDR